MIDYTRPIPCTKFINQSFTDQLAHIGSEVEEASIAYGDYVADVYKGDGDQQTKDKAHLAEELTDIITAATTALEMLGCDAEAREALQVMVNEKNERRGYWRDKDGRD